MQSSQWIANLFSLIDDAAGHPKVLYESDSGFCGDTSLLAKDPFGAGERIANEVLGCSEIKCE